MSGICGIVFNDTNIHLSSDSFLPMVKALSGSQIQNEFIENLGFVVLGAFGFPGRLTGVDKKNVYGSCYAIAFHGSIFNMLELLPEGNKNDNVLMRLLSSYLKQGVDFLRELRGEFVISIWDGSSETLCLATDRFRVHPLFYYNDKDKIIFSTRIKGIMASPFTDKLTINPEAVVDVVTSSVIPTPKTIFKEIKKLPPGHVLEYKKGIVRLKPYWDISFLHASMAREPELVQQLKTQLSDAVAARLRVEDSSSRIGTFLSGGVDSSTITGILIQQSKQPIQSFSIGFGEQQFNEISYARIAARAFSVEHHEYFVSPKDTYEVIPVLLDMFDEPFGNASAIPTYFCSKIARDHGVNVLYAGDGGDELFAGNERYASQRVFEYYYKIPLWLRKSIVKPTVIALADFLQCHPFTKGKKYILRASIPYPDRLSSYGFLRVIPLSHLVSDDLLQFSGEYDPYQVIAEYYHNAPAKDDLDRQLYIDLKYAISDNDLFKVTRMTEAAGVTVRFPFLDHYLAEFACTIPADIKMPGRKLRAFFKKAYADMLPIEVIKKKKHGFGLPIPVWLRTDRQLNDMMHDLVLSPRSVQRGYFQKKTLENIIECHKEDKTSFYGTALWNLMILELWHRAYWDHV